MPDQETPPEEVLPGEDWIVIQHPTEEDINATVSRDAYNRGYEPHGWTVVGEAVKPAPTPKPIKPPREGSE